MDDGGTQAARSDAAGAPFQVTPALLRRHAGHLDVAADDLGATVRAGGSTQPGPEAYGRLCVMVPALLDQVQAPLVEALEAAARSVRRTAEAMTDVAAAYEHTDESVAEQMSRIGRSE